MAIESVNPATGETILTYAEIKSLPSRGAWIEIP